MSSKNQSGGVAVSVTPGSEPDLPYADASAFAAGLAEMRPQLYLRAFSLFMQDAAGADDLVQATIERALSHRHLFHAHAGSSLKAWVTLIMRNLFIDEWRKTASCVDVNPDELEGHVQEGRSIEPADLLYPADVEDALENLSPNERLIFELAYFRRSPHREIAMRLGTRVSTIGTRLFRIKGKLRRVLERVYRHRLGELKGT